MAEYYEKEKVIEFIRSYQNSTDVAFHMEKHVHEIPAADVMEIVRCKDCKYYNKRYWESGRCYGTFCDLNFRDHGKTFFCASGEKREAKHD